MHPFLLDPPEVPGIKDSFVVEGNQFTYSCPYIPGSPAMTKVTWTRNGVTVSSSTHLMLTSVNHTRDEGFYTCIAENTMQPTGGEQQPGHSNKSFHLNVNCKYNLNT